MSQTNDRRKTFNTPLDWLRWALEQPGLRIAKTKNGHLCKIEISGREKIVSYRVETDNGALGLSDCPLTAVEDEHGVIPEPEPELRHPKTTLGEVANWLEDIAVCKDEGDRLGASRQAAHFISKLMDERIAAAVFEVEIGNGQWMKRPDYRIKPSWKKS